MTSLLPRLGRSRLLNRSCLAAATAALLGATAVLAPAPAAAATGPDLGRGTAFLVAPARLIDGHYYEAFAGFSDYGLTIDAAFALAAAGTGDVALKRIVDFFDSGGTDANGQTVNDWTGIGTEYVSGGSLGKEAVLAQVTGYDPRSFGGKDLIAALDASVCAAASPAPDPTCAAAGNYANATSVFSQAMGVIAQLRAGHAAAAAAPVAYLESLQAPSGSWPSLIPDSGNADVDSTAIAVMALALVDTPDASAAVTAGLSWIASRQAGSGGFPGVNPDSVNSTALAVQALSQSATTYPAQIAAARSFLAGQQNADGGFNVDAATPGSDVRASAQAVSGAAGISFATLVRDVRTLPSVPPSTTPPVTASPTASSTASSTSSPTASPTASSTVRPTSTPTSSQPAPTRSAPSSSASSQPARSTPASSPAGVAPPPSSPSSWAVDPAASDAASNVAARELASTGTPVRPLLGLAALLAGAGAVLFLASRAGRPGRRAQQR